MSTAEAYLDRCAKGLLNPSPERFRQTYAALRREDADVALVVEHEERKARTKALGEAIRLRRLPAECRRTGLRYKRSELRTQTFDCRFKASKDPDTIKLYACVWGNIDRGDDLIQPHAVRNVDEFLKDGWIALNHRGIDLPIAYPTDAEQDSYGFLVSCRWHDTPVARDARTVVRERRTAGKSVKSSIGYLSVEEAFEKRDGRTIRILRGINVYECSIVNLPMNPLAGVVADDDDKGNRTRDVVDSNVYA